MPDDIIHEKQDLTHLCWTVAPNEPVAGGSFLKAYEEKDGKKLLYKLSNFDRFGGINGHECVNELIVDRLLTILGVPHLHYRLIHADVLVDGKVYDTYLNVSVDFKGPGQDKAALDVYQQFTAPKKMTPLDFCLTQGWEDFLYQMPAVDYLILNRDRHGGNIEVVRDRIRQTIQPAPLFDQSLSLLCSCTNDDLVARFDVMDDKKCNNYVGSASIWENLQLIPRDKWPQFHPLQESDKAVLLDGLEDVISPLLREKIWEMIWGRWCMYETLCHS